MLQIFQTNALGVAVPQMGIAKIEIKKLTNRAGVKSNGQITHYAPIKDVLTGKKAVSEADQADMPNLEFDKDGFVKPDNVKQVQQTHKEKARLKQKDRDKIEVLKPASKTSPEYVKVKGKTSLSDVEGYHVGDFVLVKTKNSIGNVEYKLHHIPSDHEVRFFGSLYNSWDRKDAIKIAESATKAGLKHLSDDNAFNIFESIFDSMVYTPKLTDEQKERDAKREKSGTVLKPESGFDVAVLPIGENWKKVVGKQIGDYILSSTKSLPDYFQEFYTSAEQVPLPDNLASFTKGTHYQVQHIPTGALLGSTEYSNFKNKKQLEQFAKIVSADKEFNDLMPRNADDFAAGKFDKNAVNARLKQLLQTVKNNA